MTNPSASFFYKKIKNKLFTCKHHSYVIKNIGMKLQAYFKKQKIKRYSHWCKKHGFDPSLIHRVLKGGDIKLSTAVKISEATGGQVTIGDLARLSQGD